LASCNLPNSFKLTEKVSYVFSQRNFPYT
jgi:hypothetical protein